MNKREVMRKLMRLVLLFGWFGSASALTPRPDISAAAFAGEWAVNGTQGTDHGSGAAAYVPGGAVQGGRVIADWPGLARAERSDGRDLRVTTDVRAVLRPLLHEHLGAARAALDASVLPGSGGLPRLELLRG